MNPIAPHLTEENRERQQLADKPLYQNAWPVFDPEKCVDNTVENVIQVCGKIKERMVIAPDAPADEVLAAAKKLPKVADAIEGKTPVKELYVPGKLVNLVDR